MKLKDKVSKSHPFNYLIIILVALILISPQLITQNMIIGSDSIFHFNRFYETSEQIKNNNFDYFISLYGFQQSGRIVNAFYSPFFAYFQGLIVLISKNWFMYQVISNLLLFLLAGFFMNVFLARSGLSRTKCWMGAILFMTTYSIQYWTIRQGFSSWGAAFLPLCLTVVFDVLDKSTFPKYKLGIYTALMFQIHLLTSFILVLMYAPVFIYAFIKENKKMGFIKNMIQEILLFFILTANIWVSYLIITRENDLIAPFVNKSMSSNTINQNSYYWLLNPVFLIILLVLVLVTFIRKDKKESPKNKLFFGIMLVFLILSSSLVPWDFLIRHNVKLAEYIQFPFRFFVPVTILVLYFYLTWYDSKKANLAIVTLSILQGMLLIFVTLESWEKDNHYILSGEKTIIQSIDSQIVKGSFYLNDKSQALNIVQKTTPDYLPVYKKSNINNYTLYGEKIINNQDSFEKSIDGTSLIFKINNDKKAMIEIPVIIYTDTAIKSGQTPLPKNILELNSIGVPSIPSEYIKDNEINISFRPPKITYFFILLSAVSWCLICILCLIYQLKKRRLLILNKN